MTADETAIPVPATAPPGNGPVGDVPAAFAALLARTVAGRPGRRCTVFLSGGPLARDCYAAAAALPPGAVDWPAVDLYMGDERLVPPDDPDANQRLVREALLDPLGGAVGSFHPMPTDGDPAGCAARYQQVVAGVLAGPGIDLVHLGLGPDGHTASLFPGSAGLEAGPGDLVVANRDPHERNPHDRLTLTFPALARSRRTVFTVRGTEKRAAVAALRRGEDLPAARVRAGEIYWLVDGDAWGDGGR